MINVGVAWLAMFIPSGSQWYGPVATEDLGLAKEADGVRIWWIRRGRNAWHTGVAYWHMQVSGRPFMIPEAHRFDLETLPQHFRPASLEDLDMSAWYHETGFPLGALSCSVHWKEQIRDADIIYTVLWLLIGGPFALRRHLRRQHGSCIKCGYDLRGASHGACPECGTAPKGRKRTKPIAFKFVAVVCRTAWGRRSIGGAIVVLAICVALFILRPTATDVVTGQLTPEQVAAMPEPEVRAAIAKLAEARRSGKLDPVIATRNWQLLWDRLRIIRTEAIKPDSGTPCDP